MSELTKLKTINISDSNIAGLGTELEKQVRLNAAQTEKAWKDIGKEVGRRVWRIENFHIVPVDPKTYGTFYDGDAYIILNTYKKPNEPKLFHDVHFWLGLETSQDEAGTAAYKTVELDDFLLGAPTQHREVQGFESPLFLTYFPNLVINHGGIASGFKHVGPKEYKTRLYHISGNKAKNLTVNQVERSFKSLNSGDVFVLDAGLKIYQFNGEKSSPQERRKASEFAHQLSSDRGGSKCQVFDEGDADATPFWEAIGGQGPISPPLEIPIAAPTLKTLFKVSDATGSLQVTRIASGSSIPRSNLQSDDVFLLDIGTAVYVWVGKGASPQERKMGLQVAVDYLVKNQLPPTTPISRILEGGENAEFYSYFS